MDAAEHGNPEQTIAPLSWLMQRAQGLAPNFLTHALSLVNRRLPAPGPPGRTSKMILGAEVVTRSRDERARVLGAEVAADAAHYRPDAV